MATSKLTNDLLDCVSCSVCMEHYDNNTHVPQILPCQHTFCKDCLDSLVSWDRLHAEVPCPVCRREHRVPSTGFTTNRAVLDMVDSLKKNTRSSVLACADHPDRECVLICTNCLVGLCAKCMKALRKSPHRDHDLEELPEAKTVLYDKFCKLVKEEQAVLEQTKSKITGSPYSVREITNLEATVQNLNDTILAKTKSWTREQLSLLKAMKQTALALTNEIEMEKGKLQSILEQQDMDIVTLISLITNFKGTLTRDSRQQLQSLSMERNAYNLQANCQTLMKRIKSVVDPISAQKWQFIHKPQVSKHKIPNSIVGAIVEGDFTELVHDFIHDTKHGADVLICSVSDQCIVIYDRNKKCVYVYATDDQDKDAVLARNLLKAKDPRVHDKFDYSADVRSAISCLLKLVNRF